MRRTLAYFLFASPLMAQLFGTAPQQAPIDALIQSYQSALNAGKYDEVAAKRDQARALLSQIPVDDPQFANWTQRVSQLYEYVELSTQARDVLEQALVRAGRLGEASSARVTLLVALAGSWQLERNLLKSVSYMEQAVAATEARSRPEESLPAVINESGDYQWLYNLNRQLGRPQDAAATVARAAAHVKDYGFLASLYLQQGQLDDAIASARRQAAQASDPQQSAAALQSLAGMFQQTGQIQAADETYQQLMAAGGQTNQQLGITTGYADFLEQTNRADQAEALLNDYQFRHLNAEPSQETNLMLALANVERLLGRQQLAEEYQRRAYANKPQAAPQLEMGDIVTTLQHALDTAYASKLDEAFNLTLQALDGIPGAVNRQWGAAIASDVASILARKAPAQADEIYRRLFELDERWSPVTVIPLLNLHYSYAQSLANQGRWNDFEAALERYRAVLTAARGGQTVCLAGILRLRVETVNRPERRQDALAASQELVALEESLSGTTSEQYLGAVETLAQTMETTGDRAGALPLRSKTVMIADLVYKGSNEARRAVLRTDAAMAFARAGQFDEAEALAREALAISQHIHPPQPGWAANTLQQVLQMKQAALTNPAQKQ